MKKLYFLLFVLTSSFLQINAQTCTAGFRLEPLTANPLGRHFIPVLDNSQQKKPVQICWRFGDDSVVCKNYAANYTGSYVVEHVYRKPGNYEVCVTIKYDGGCEAKKCELVKIEGPLNECTVKINEVAGPANLLERQFYLGLTENSKAEKICWVFGDGTQEQCYTVSNPPTQHDLIRTHKYAAPGTYRLCVKVWYAGGCVVEKCKEVIIKPAISNNTCGGYLTETLLSPKVVLFKGFGIQNPNDTVLSYQWTFGDGTSATGKDVKHEYTEMGTYNVCLTMKTRLGCETKICKKIVLEGSINEPKLILSPNPVLNTLHVIFHSTKAEMVSIRIYSVNGIMVKNYTKNTVTGKNEWDFADISTLPTGAYSVVVQSPSQFANAIFFKQ